jgi:hypothetical protein
VRTLAIAIIMAALAVPALGQDVAGSNKHHGAEKKRNEPAKTEANDKDYKAALDRLPQQKFDPWGTTRSAGDKPADKH